MFWHKISEGQSTGCNKYIVKSFFQIVFIGKNMAPEQPNTLIHLLMVLKEIYKTKLCILYYFKINMENMG